MYGYVPMAMYVWLCKVRMAMYGYVPMAMYVWLCNVRMAMSSTYGYIKYV